MIFFEAHTRGSLKVTAWAMASLLYRALDDSEVHKVANRM
jgi:hypothetical protein